METFSYKAVDASGKDVKGAVEAESKDEAARKIKEQGFTPISIGKQGALDKDVNLSFFGPKKIPARDMSVFCRQFASILKAGVSVINALEMLVNRQRIRDLKKQLREPSPALRKAKTFRIQ